MDAVLWVFVVVMAGFAVGLLRLALDGGLRGRGRLPAPRRRA